MDASDVRSATPPRENARLSSNLHSEFQAAFKSQLKAWECISIAEIDDIYKDLLTATEFLNALELEEDDEMKIHDGDSPRSERQPLPEMSLFERSTSALAPKSLSTAHNTSPRAAKEDEYSKICAICLSDLRNAFADLKALPCMHIFCRECIQEWVSRGTPTCPICRLNIKNVDFRSDLSQAEAEARSLAADESIFEQDVQEIFDK